VVEVLPLQGASWRSVDLGIVLPVRHTWIEEVMMSNPATTRMSSKGQVVIPEEIRTRLGLTAGTQFVVIGDKGVVVLKTLTSPRMSDFDELAGQARRQARKAGLKRSDVADAVQAAKNAEKKAK